MSPSCLALKNSNKTPDTKITAGEIIMEPHLISNTGNDINYSVTFDIADSWFNNPNASEYGFVYGVDDTSGNPLMGTDTIILPGESFNVSFWYGVKENMITPLEPVHITIWVNATVI